VWDAVTRTLAPTGTVDPEHLHRPGASTVSAGHAKGGKLPGELEFTTKPKVAPAECAAQQLSKKSGRAESQESETVLAGRIQAR
jgi:hypothetical protein